MILLIATAPHRHRRIDLYRGGGLTWLLVCGLLVCGLLGDLPSLNFSRYHYDSTGLTTGATNLTTSDLYNAETDAAGNRFVWTKARPIFNFSFKPRQPIQLTFQVRSAAVAGGPDVPIAVVVNGQSVGQLQPDPHNAAFQTFTLKVVPPAEQPLTVELLPQSFKPPTDQRILGTMIKSITVEADWSALVKRWCLLAGGVACLSLLALGLLVWQRRRGSRRAGYGAVGCLLVGATFPMVAAWLFYPFTDWLPDTNFALVVFAGLGFVALICYMSAVSLPVVGGRSLYRWAYRRLDRPSAVPIATPPKKPVASLTGLRIIAALLIYMTHLPMSPDQFPDWLINIHDLGRIGVPLFFVLSGFVICYNYFDGLASRPLPNLWSFFMARIARIYPMHLLVLLLAIGAVAGPDWDVIQRDPYTFVQQLSLVESWNGYTAVRQAYFYNSPAWSLGVEFFLYLCFPILALTVLRWCRQTWQLLALGGGSLIGPFLAALWFSLNTDPSAVVNYPLVEPDFWVGRYPVAHLGDFVLGCVAALLYGRWRTRPVGLAEARLGRLGLYGSVAAVGLLMAYQPTPYWWWYYKQLVVFLPFFGLIVFCLARYRSLLSRFLSSRGMVLLGEASFSFYMLHFFVIQLAKPRLTVFNDARDLLFGFMVLVVSLLLSLGAYTYLETPARRLLRRWAERRSALPQPVHSAGRPDLAADPPQPTLVGAAKE